MGTLHEELTVTWSSAPRCKLCTFLATSPEAEEWKTELALPPEVVSHEAVVRALASRNIEVTTSSVKRHRKNHS